MKIKENPDPKINDNCRQYNKESVLYEGMDSPPPPFLNFSLVKSHQFTGLNPENIKVFTIMETKHTSHCYKMHLSNSLAKER